MLAKGENLKSWQFGWKLEIGIASGRESLAKREKGAQFKWRINLSHEQCFSPLDHIKS